MHSLRVTGLLAQLRWVYCKATCGIPGSTGRRSGMRPDRIPAVDRTAFRSRPEYAVITRTWDGSIFPDKSSNVLLIDHFRCFNISFVCPREQIGIDKNWMNNILFETLDSVSPKFFQYFDVALVVFS